MNLAQTQIAWKHFISRNKMLNICYVQQHMGARTRPNYKTDHEPRVQVCVTRQYVTHRMVYHLVNGWAKAGENGMT